MTGPEAQHWCGSPTKVGGSERGRRRRENRANARETRVDQTVKLTARFFRLI